jgi:hypothetical protein
VDGKGDCETDEAPNDQTAAEQLTPPGDHDILETRFRIVYGSDGLDTACIPFATQLNDRRIDHGNFGNFSVFGDSRL